MSMYVVKILCMFNKTTVLFLVLIEIIVKLDV